MLRKRFLTAGAALALGAGASAGVAACGEDRGSVQIEGGTGTDKTGTAGTESSGPKTSETSKTETSP